MIAFVVKLLWSSMPARATAVSGAVHVGAFAVAAVWPVYWTDWHTVDPRDEVHSIQFHLTLVQPEREPLAVDVEMPLDDDPVVVMRERAMVLGRRFVETPTNLPATEMEIALVDELLADVRSGEATGVSRLVESPRVAVAQPQPVIVTTPRPVERKVATLVQPKPPSVGSEGTIPPDFSGNTLSPYPEPALRRGIEGRVLLRLFVDEDGQVTKVEIARSSGHPILDATAAKDVRKWRGKPAHRDGKPVATVQLLPVRYVGK